MDKHKLKPVQNRGCKLCCIVFVFFSICMGYSQTVRYDSLSKKKYIMVDVQKTYQRIADNGYESFEVCEFLGNYYYENNNPRKCKLYFDKLFEKYDLSKISSVSKERYQLINK